MKEATGELNMTVITVVAIAAIGAFFMAFVWPQLKGSVQGTAKCSSAVGCKACSSGSRKCDGYYDDSGTYVEEEITCSCEG